MKKIILLNCYSRKNSGDGLLVDLAIDKIKKLEEDCEIDVVSCDKTFEDEGIHSILNEAKSNPSLLRYLMILCKIIKFIFTGKYKILELDELKYDKSYSVGGGYLRYGSIHESLKTTLVHIPQLCWASHRFNNSHIMLAQSIGPHNFFSKFILRRVLKNFKEIHVRDDRTVDDLKDMGIKSRRESDLAVVKIKNKIKNIRRLEHEEHEEHGSVCIVVLRDFRRSKNETNEIISKINHINSIFDKVVYAIQSETLGNNDREFYAKFGIKANLLLKEALSVYPNAVVVSVRLHGALESILQGYPTYHLSYERKGFGAYGDLNISEYVQNVYSFDVKKYMDGVAELKEIQSTGFLNKISS
jgi:polysaccharide pyruvyl transferase WcaK-like protein